MINMHRTLVAGDNQRTVLCEWTTGYFKKKTYFTPSSKYFTFQTVQWQNIYIQGKAHTS